MQPNLVPLNLAIQQVGGESEIAENIRYSLSLGLEEVRLGLVSHDGTVCIVGSGPSLLGQAENIRKDRALGRPICAINGANDFLFENGIRPNLWLSVDPQAMTGQEPRPFVQNLLYRHPEVIYCLASRCHPTTFDYLKGYHRLLFHCWGQETENKVLEPRMCIGGGTTSGMRAVNFFYIQGFRKFHFYGMDSCLGEKKEKRFNTEPLTPDVKTMDIVVGDREFLCNGAMAQQANEFQMIWDVMPDAHINVYGGGLLSAIIEERRKHGMPT